jgi:hypothetical protein
MSLLFIVCHTLRRKMNHEHDYDHFVESVGEQLLLMLWTSVATLSGVGIILWIAL